MLDPDAPRPARPQYRTEFATGATVVLRTVSVARLALLLVRSMLHDPSAYLPRTHRLPFAPSTCPRSIIVLLDYENSIKNVF